MSDNRSIQRSDSGQRAGAIMTPQGPAIIQVIDIPAGYGAPAVAGPAGRKVGGINILGAILRRWWLVLIVTVLIGGGHIAEVYEKSADMNPLWTPPWKSIDPAEFDRLQPADYGGGDDNKLLAAIMGHNLCLDIFGGASEEERAAG